MARWTKYILYGHKMGGVGQRGFSVFSFSLFSFRVSLYNIEGIDTILGTEILHHTSN